MAERSVIGERQVPEEVDREPDRKRYGGPGGVPGERQARDRGGQERRDAENEKRRRPLGEDHVLQQVRRQEVVQRDRL
jgi:hypothetical protein